MRQSKTFHSPGRPPLPSHLLRSHRLFVRLSPDELLALRVRAARARLPLATYLRRAALHRAPPRPVPVVHIRTLGQLGRLGNNLNQLTKLAHQRQLPINLLPVLRGLDAHLRALRRHLAGLPPEPPAAALAPAIPPAASSGPDPAPTASAPARP